MDKPNIDMGLTQIEDSRMFLELLNKFVVENTCSTPDIGYLSHLRERLEFFFTARVATEPDGLIMLNLKMGNVRVLFHLELEIEESGD